MKGTIAFGYSTDTYDAEGKATSDAVPVTLDPDFIERLMGRFRGKILQVPPPVSAKKIQGTPAYKLVRTQYRSQARAGRGRDLLD